MSVEYDSNHPIKQELAKLLSMRLLATIDEVLLKQFTSVQTEHCLILLGIQLDGELHTFSIGFDFESFENGQGLEDTNHKYDVN